MGGNNGESLGRVLTLGTWDSDGLNEGPTDSDGTEDVDGFDVVDGEYVGEEESLGTPLGEVVGNWNDEETGDGDVIPDERIRHPPPSPVSFTKIMAVPSAAHPTSKSVSSILFNTG